MRVENIYHEHQLLAIVFYHQDILPGVHFYTPDSISLQVGNQLRKKGEMIKPHRHIPVQVDKKDNLQEVLYIESGKMKVNFYADEGQVVASKILNPRDMILLIAGGHGFEFLEETRMIEVKQGPYNPGSRKALETKDVK